MRLHSGAPIALNLHAIEYAAIIMRFIPQAANGWKTAYELANGKPHRLPGPIVAGTRGRVFGCLVVTTDKRNNSMMDKLSKRAVTGIYIGLGQSDKLASNCRAIKIFCPERNRVIQADPVEVKFIGEYPWRVQRSKTLLLDRMVRFKIRGQKDPTTGIVIAFEAPMFTVLLQTGRLVRGTESEVQSWIQAWNKRNRGRKNLPTVSSDSLDQIMLPMQQSLNSLEARGVGCAHDTAYDDEYDAADWDLAIYKSRAQHVTEHNHRVRSPNRSRAPAPDSSSASQLHREGDMLQLPPNAIRGHDKPFVGVVVSRTTATSNGGSMSYLRSIELGDKQVRGFDSHALDVHATRVHPRGRRMPLSAYAHATGQDESMVRDVVETTVNLAFNPRAEHNVLMWASSEYDPPNDDAHIDRDRDSTKEFESPPMRDNAHTVSSVDGFIRSLSGQALDNLNQDVYRDPQNDAQADRSEFRKEWAAARQKEIDALIKNNVLSSEEIPKNVRGKAKVLSMKWVYKKKPEKFKARLVIRGFTQTEGDNTFDKDMVLSPTAHGPSVRLLIAIAVQTGRHLGTFDVANAFQQGEFTAGEVIHVRMPKNAGSKVLRLLTPLYGLKQSGRCFSEKLHTCLTGIGFRRAIYESCLYIYEEVDEMGVTQRLDILLHVDDGLYSTTSIPLKERKFNELGDQIEFTDSGELETYLGVDYTHDKATGSYAGSSESYFRRSFERLGLGYMFDSSFQTKDVPFNPSVDLSPCDDDVLYDEETCPINMRVLVGVLSYAAATTRPDLSYIVNVLASTVGDPRPKHVEAAYHCFSYVAGTIDMGIVYSRERDDNGHNWRFDAYSDADWASNTLTRRSRSGILLKLSGAPIIWKSHLQATIALSTTEAEYNALVYLGCEILYVFRILGDMDMKEEIVGGSDRIGIRKAMPVKVDNMSTIRIAENPFNMRRTRHIEIRHMKVLEWVRAGLIQLEYVPSAENLADFFTKPARRAVFTSNRDSMMSKVSTTTSSLDDKGLMSYEAGEFEKPTKAKTSVSIVDSDDGLVVDRDTEHTSELWMLHRQMIDEANQVAESK